MRTTTPERAAEYQAYAENGDRGSAKDHATNASVAAVISQIGHALYERGSGLFALCSLAPYTSQTTSGVARTKQMNAFHSP